MAEAALGGESSNSNEGSSDSATVEEKSEESLDKKDTLSAATASVG
jgi:hypothetical protein